MALFIDATVPNTLAPSVSFGEPKTNASGGKNVALFYNRAIATFTTPMLSCYGVNRNQFDETKPETFDITLQTNETSDSRVFVDNILALETMIKQKAFENSRKWFGKQMSQEVINEFWTDFAKYPKNKDTGEVDKTKNPTIRLKLSYFDSSFKYLEVYNVTNQLIYPKSNAEPLQDMIPKGSEVKCLVRLNGIWFAGGKFGLTGKPIQIIVRPKVRMMPGVCQMMMPVATTSTSQCDELMDLPEEMVETTTEVKVTVDDSDDEDPDKEYASTPSEVPSTETSEPSAEAPVKRRPRVVKKGV